ncbi:MAG TPA: NAD(P)-dependent oxidoreductase [Planctomycetota bacterium]|nr:NAD(P)-dependent oxidoreductase [Planctomycetota bacterium]
MVNPRTVLVTGSRGAIGRVVTGALRADGHRVRGLDRKPGTHADDLVGDLDNVAALRRACAGTQVILHFAATPDVADFVSELVPNNVAGPWNLLAAAVAENVPRVLLASSCRVVHGRTWQGVLRVDDPVAPPDGYGLTKEFGERMGAFFARRHGIAVIAARIGFFCRDQREFAVAGSSARALYLSWEDCARFASAVVAATWVGYHTVFVVGADGGALYDLDPGRRLLGWEPRDVHPQGTPLSA